MSPPDRARARRADHPGEEIGDGQVFTQPWPATAEQKEDGRRDKVTYYRYKAGSARRSLHGIDTQIAKAERAVAGKEAVKRNRFVKLTGGDKSINRDLEAKARSIAESCGGDHGCDQWGGQSTGLHDLLTEHLSVDSPNRVAKAGCDRRDVGRCRRRPTRAAQPLVEPRQTDPEQQAGHG
ncbi:MAG: hypothetical protein KKA97_00825, partial [Actinobacteria bacterium]|nr:hypothetical protein [Actinomycetota bacterium]